MSQCPADSYADFVPRGSVYSGSRGIVVISAANTRTELDVYSTGQVNTLLTAASLAQTNQTNTSSAAATTSLAAETTRATAAESAISAAVTAETTRATSAESVLRTSIATETTRATAAESAISAAVTAETTRAGSAESAISAAVTAETTRATAAESAISASVAAETTRATTAESAISAAVTAETTRATATESTISAAVTAETTRAGSAESTISAAVTAETTRATAAESTISAAVTAETTRATAAELALTNTFSSYLPRAGGTMTAPINMASHAITNLPSPSNASDAVCKSYVDNVSAGLTAYPSVRAYVASTAGYTYANGVAGVGATLTVVNSASTPLVFDGYTPLVGERVLVNSSTNLHANGIYILTTSRVSGNTCVFTRAEYFDGDPLTELHPGAMFYVTAGTVYANTSFVQVSPIPATVGVSPVQYTQFSALPIIVNGPNVNIVGNQIGVTPTLTNISSVQLASTPSAGTVTLQQSPASSTYTVSLPAAAPTANTLLKYDGTNYAWSALSAGANIGVSGMQVGLSPALSQINSVALQHTDASAGVVTVSKASGSASYALALPSSAPATGNVLTCSGSGAYSWSAPVQAGTNVGVSGNTVALNAALSDINSVALRNLDASAGVVTVSKSPGASSYALALPSAAPVTGNVLTCSGSGAYSWSAPVQAGANVGVSGNTVALNAALSNINSVALRNLDASAGVVTVSKATGAASYALALPSAAPVTGNVLTCSGTDTYSWSSPQTLVPGNNLAISGNTVSLNAALSGINSVALRNTDASAGVVTVSKATGAASYALALPAAAPSANTALVYDGSNYVWGAAASGSSAGTYAGGYLMVENLTSVPITTTNLQPFPFTNITSPSGSAPMIIVNSPITRFTLASGYTYKCTAQMGANSINSSDFITQWSNVTASVPGAGFGGQGNINSVSPRGILTVGYITNNTAGNIVIALIVTGGDGKITPVPTSPWATIEVVSNNTISQFIGATSSTNGVVGYIPAPPAGTQNSYLRGDGNWVQANNAPTAANYIMAAHNTTQNVWDNANISFNTVLVSTGSITQPTTSSFLLPAGASYKCTAIVPCRNNAFGYQFYASLSSSSGYARVGLSGQSIYSITPPTGSLTAAVAYITTTSVPQYLILRCLYNAGDIPGDIGAGLSPWCTIEQVSNNSVITAFTGATSSTAGVVGYIPAPPAGTQNSYLRGDGTWQQANNAPTAAQYCHAVQPATTGPYNTGNFFLYAVPATIAGSAIAQTSATQFTLQVGYTYKCTADLCQTGGGVNYKWYNVTTSASFGTQGSLNYAGQSPTAVGYITPTVTTVIGVYFSGAGGVTVNGGNQSSNGALPWATIEVVSNNNTIGPFTGATSSTAGIVGYIPAPPAGTQNSYLRGDGTWQQANNGPTAAQYCYAVQTASSGPYNTGNFFRYAVPATIAGSAIAQTSQTQFTLQVGYTYKCTADLTDTNNGVNYKWYNVTDSVSFGSQGSINYANSPTAIGYITPTLTTVIGLYISGGAGNVTVNTGNQSSNGSLPWATIEVVSNNNTIGPFTGATASTAGIVGYIPAPPAGTQNSYLRGDGTWQQANNGPTTAIAMHVAYIAAVNQTIPTTIGAAFPYNTVTFSTGTSGVITPSPNATNITTFVLAAGNTYKCTAQVGYNNVSGASCLYQWSTVPYVAGTTTLFGVVGDMNGSRSPTAIGYITASTTTTVALIMLVGTAFTGGPGAGFINTPWATIEVFSNNNAIMPFTGATSSTAGIVGYIPAPPAGTQNSYLRGDGTWQQANNAPTAAQYLMVTQPNLQTVSTGTIFPWSTTPMMSTGGGAITQASTTQFQLAAGYTFKLTSALNYNNANAEVSYCWYDLTNAKSIGVGGDVSCAIAPQNGTAVAYISTTVTTTVQLRILWPNSSVTIAPIDANGNRVSWATIEVVSNNNTIGPFMGATASASGIVGYIPAPPAGSQNSYLRGDGIWAQANNAPTAAICMHVSYIAAVGAYVPTTTGAAFPFNTVSFSMGASGVIVPNTGTITTFTLAAGNTYKCTAQIGYYNVDNDFMYQWSSVPYVAGTTTLFGTVGEFYRTLMHNPTAIGYITATTTMTISLIVLTNGSLTGGVNMGGLNGFVSPPWATIEVVSNNNTITAFTGATSSTAGVVGYIPAPPAGTQDSYLRGDGTWQQANNAPTAAQYYMVGLTQSANAGTSVNANINFDTPMGSLGNMITQPTMNTFLLAAGASYKLRACVINSGNVQVVWYNITTGAFIGIIGVSYNTTGVSVYAPGIADGFITTTINTTVGVRCIYSSGAIGGTSANGGYPYSKNFAWAIIEQTSNNNTITAFTGATSSTDGIVGYIPAPPAGTQDSYLRGDGTWQQANNAPTAAEYLMATNNADNTMSAVNTPIQFSNLLFSAGSKITKPTSTTFVLAANCTYKCTAVLTYANTTSMIFQWYNVTTSTLIGVAGYVVQSPKAVAYITPTVTTTISLYLTYAPGTIYGYSQPYQRGPWCSIEVVSNNNTITQFAGATGSAAGSIGYIPAPAVGQQQYYLTGAGSWAPPPSLTGTGSIQQAISSTTSAYYNSNSNWTSVPGLTLTLTPNSTASQFLLRASITYALDLSGAVLFRFMRGSTPIGLNNASSGLVGSFRSFIGSTTTYATTASGDYLDAPATTSSITYSVQCITFSTVKIMFNASISSQAGTVDPSGAISTLTITQC